MNTYDCDIALLCIWIIDCFLVYQNKYSKNYILLTKKAPNALTDIWNLHIGL